MPVRKIGIVLAVLIWTSVFPSGISAAEAPKDVLARAHAAKMKRSYEEARKIFLKLARDKAAPDEVRQEAGYFMGFCSIMDKDYVRAIHDFRWYLKAFPGKDAKFAPDTLFVLGRTHEMLGEPQAAATYFDQCLKWPHAPDHPFKAKAKAGLDRVREMLLEEEKLLNAGVGTRQVQASDTVRLRRDPYSQKAFAPGQYQRIKKFTEVLGKSKDLEQAQKVLAPEDRELAMVQQIFRMFEEHRKLDKRSPQKGKKKPEKG